MHVVFLSSGNQGEKNTRGITRAPRNLLGILGHTPGKFKKSNVPEMPFATFWERLYRISLKIIKRRIKYAKDNTF